MKKNLIIFIVLMFICCKIKKNSIFVDSFKTEQYKIYKIDSINNYYLFYARKEDSLYKIVSKKYSDKQCIRIQIKVNYNLHLNSIYKDRLAIMKKYNLSSISKWGIDDTLKISTDSIKYYYTTEDIKGMCLIKR